MSAILIRDCVVVPMTGTKDGPGDGRGYFTGSVAIEENRIVLVTDREQRVDEFRAAASRGGIREIDGRGKLLLPGLVNTHTHVAMTLMRGYADDIPLMEWLHERVWPFESLLTPADVSAGARLGVAEMLLGGTTTMVDMYWHEATVAEVALGTGIRAVLCPGLVDGERMNDFERDLADTMAVAARCDRLAVRVAPHAAYSCSAENLRRAVELALRHGLGMHVHVSETLEEQRIVRARHDRTPTEYLLEAGVFDVPAIAAHCVHVTDGDMELLRSRGVTVAHNPQSNMKLASGAAPVARMLERGLNVTLGTDGASSNNDLDMWDEMRAAALLGKLVAADPAATTAWEVLRMATAEGARAIGMEGVLGVVAEGALADLVMLDIEKPHWCPCEDPVSALVYSAKSSDVDTVFVDGRMLVSGGSIVGFDVDEAMRDAAQATARIKNSRRL